MFAHSEAIGRLSPALFKMLNGPMLEAETRMVTFSTVQPQDFIRLCEFAYTGDYNSKTSVSQDSEDCEDSDSDLRKEQTSKKIVRSFDKSKPCHSITSSRDGLALKKLQARSGLVSVLPIMSARTS
jgi:hypothetical protein